MESIVYERCVVFVQVDTFVSVAAFHALGRHYELLLSSQYYTPVKNKKRITSLENPMMMITTLSLLHRL
jgi:hypothetical protein